jgi:multicomponent Na+:H+ antiporter subunit B
MRNIILEKIATLFLRVMALSAIALLLRGHNQPGGGFIGGIILSTGFILYGMVFGTSKIRKVMVFDSRIWMGIGLLLVVTAALIPAFAGQPPLTGLWFTAHLPLIGTFHMGTPQLFDTGVFIAVVGVILSIIITIMEVLQWNT